MPASWPRAPLVVFALALVVRAAAAAAIAFPIPEGSAYYVAAAGNLAAGRGLVVDLLWSYATPPLVLPRPAFDLWQPLASLVAAPFVAIVGSPLLGAQIPSVVLGALAAPLAWAFARRAATELGLPAVRAASAAVTAGLLVALTPLLVVQAAEPDSAVVYTVLVLAACLWLPAAVAERPPSRSRRVLLGAAIGLAYLARQEALAVALVYLLLAWWRAARDGIGVRTALGRAALTLSVSAVVIIPWLIRQAATWRSSPFGQALENAWFTSHTDVFAWSTRPTLASHLAIGLESLLALRLDALVGSVLLLLVAAFPTGLLGLLALGVRPSAIRATSVVPLALVALVVFLTDVLLLPVSSGAGLWAHGSGPAVALLAVAAAILIDRVIGALAAVRGWATPTDVTGRLALLGPLFVTLLAVPVTSLAASLEHERSVIVEAQYAALGAAASRWDVPPGPIITDHPMWLATSLGRPALALPREPPAAVVDLARHFTAVAVVGRDEDVAGVLAALAEHMESGALCFRELAAPAPFRALAFVCRTQLASTSTDGATASGVDGPRPYTGPRVSSP